MPVAKGSKKIEDRYLDLVRQFPLRPIRSDRELDKAVKMIDSLLSRTSLLPEEEDYLDVLGDLVKRYESETYPIASVSDAEMLSHRIEAKCVTQTEVSESTGIAVSTISEILAGKRALNRTHIDKLARYFKISAAVFAF
jgi:HTH-type transcriptional regulator/antitoxin HigA